MVVIMIPVVTWVVMAVVMVVVISLHVSVEVSGNAYTAPTTQHNNTTTHNTHIVNSITGIQQLEVIAVEYSNDLLTNGIAITTQRAHNMTLCLCVVCVCVCVCGCVCTNECVCACGCGWLGVGVGVGVGAVNPNPTGQKHEITPNELPS